MRRDLFSTVGVLRAVAALIALMCAPSCGGAVERASTDELGQSLSGKGAGPVGVWEMKYHDAVGQPYMNVLELSPDGAYTTYMQDATPSDRGTYVIANGALVFSSAVDPRLSQAVAYELADKSTLQLTLNTPDRRKVDWRRSDLSPLFETTSIMGAEIPENISGLVMAAMQARVLQFQADAMPTAIEVTRDPAGHAEIRMDFYSTGTGNGYRMTVAKYHVTAQPIDGSRMNQRPLPAEFADLSAILSSAAADGVSGAFRRADLRSYDGAGPAWMIRTEGPRGATYSAVTGERITGDVTGYIAQYEADWARAGALWRQAMARRHSDGDQLANAFKKAQVKYDSGVCELDGGDWRNGACY
jgi:hypothetical protein